MHTYVLTRNALRALICTLTLFSSAVALAGLAKNETTGKTYTQLQEAIDEANSGDSLELKGMFIGSFVIDNKTIMLEGKEDAILDGVGENTTLVISNDSNVGIKYLTIQSGFSTFLGGGINCTGSFLTLEHVKLINNSAQFGGGLYFEGSNNTKALVVRDSKIENNSAGSNGVGGGGGMFISSANVFLTDCEIERNQAINGTDGGGLLITDSQAVALSRLKVKENSADSVGGGIALKGSGSNTIQRCFIYTNSAQGNGGGIYVVSSQNARIVDSKEVKNAAADGGGIFVESGAVVVFVDNKAYDNVPNNISGS